jgi:hypothetical protein
MEEKKKTVEIKTIIEKYEIKIQQMEQQQQFRVRELMTHQQTEFNNEIIRMKSELFIKGVEVQGYEQENRELREMQIIYGIKINEFKKNCVCNQRKLLE